jgi:hypothetical protein
LNGKARNSWKKCPVLQNTMYVKRMLDQCRAAYDRQIALLPEVQPEIRRPLYTFRVLLEYFGRHVMKSCSDNADDKPVAWATSFADSNRFLGAARLVSIESNGKRTTPASIRSNGSRATVTNSPSLPLTLYCRPYQNTPPDHHWGRDNFLKRLMHEGNCYFNNVMHKRVFLYCIMRHAYETGETFQAVCRDVSVYKKFADFPTPNGNPYEVFFDTRNKAIEVAKNIATKTAIEIIQSVNEFFNFTPKPEGNQKVNDTILKQEGRQKAWSVIVEIFTVDGIHTLFEAEHNNAAPHLPYSSIVASPPRNNNDVLSDTEAVNILDPQTWIEINAMICTGSITVTIMKCLVEARLLWCKAREMVWNLKDTDIYESKKAAFHTLITPPQIQDFIRNLERHPN